MRLDNVKWVCAAIALILTSVLWPVPAQAQIPSNGVFYGCMRTDSGQDDGKFVRLVSASEACRRNEIRISWNQQGPKGDTGAAGMGATVAGIYPGGACGPVGGVQVTDGNGHSELICDGAKGEKGDKGDKGDTGDNAQGVIGEGSNSGQVPITIAAGDSANGNGNVVVTKQATGFRGYVAWAAVAVRINNTGAPNNAGAVSCAIKQSTPSINGGAPALVDARGFATIVPALNGAVVYNIALVGDSPGPADNGDEITTFSVVCGYNGSPSTPPSNVAAVSSSLVVMGLNGTFEIPGN